MKYFILSPFIYPASCGDSIIILDSKNDNYISLIDDAAVYLPQILNKPFTYDADTSRYGMVGHQDDQLDYWITFFLEQNFITPSDVPNSRLIAPAPLRAGGLSDYQWDMKKSWQPFRHTRWWDLCKAFVMLARVHWRMKRNGIQGLVDLIDPIVIKNEHQPTEKEIETLSHAVDAASMLYPKKTYCLAWAATFVALARQKGWSKAELVIGVQGSPFYAHAWAEIAGVVIHDDPIIAEVLSIIMKTPRGN